MSARDNALDACAVVCAYLSGDEEAMKVLAACADPAVYTQWIPAMLTGALLALTGSVEASTAYVDHVAAGVPSSW